MVAGAPSRHVSTALCCMIFQSYFNLVSAILYTEQAARVTAERHVCVGPLCCALCW
jgi:hypothetical protein